MLGKVGANIGRRDEVITRLDDAQAGFAHLWPRMARGDTDFVRSLAAQCRCLIQALAEGDLGRLHEEEQKAAPLLATAKRYSPNWNWSVDKRADVRLVDGPSAVAAGSTRTRSGWSRSTTARAAGHPPARPGHQHGDDPGVAAWYSSYGG